MPLPVKIMAGYYLLINLFLFLTMGYDKNRAKKNKWRVSESTLYLLSFFGGGIGGFLGMFHFHHKTKKPAFYLLFGIAVILHFTFIVFLFRFIYQ